MVELVCLSAIGVIVLFAGFTILIDNLFQVTAIFVFLTMLVGYVLLILTYRKRQQLLQAQQVIYQGYEKHLYYGSMVIIVIDCLMIYMGHIHIQSMISPILVINCFVPLIAYLSHESLLVFYKKDFIYNGKRIRYKDVRSLEIFDYKKNKKKLLLHAKEEMIYTGRNQAIQEVIEAFCHYCQRIEVRENL